MKTYFPSWLHQTLIILLWGVVFYISSFISLKFDAPNSSITIVRFPSGVAVAAFLCVRWRDYPWLILTFALMTVIQNEAWKSWSTFLFGFGYALLAMPASIIIAWVVRRFSPPNDDLHIILLWICATFIISLLDALIIGGRSAYLTNQPIAKTLWYAFISDVTGIFFATTIIMGFMSQRIHNTMQNRVIGAVLLLLLCSTTWFIFGYKAVWFMAHATALYFALSCIPIVLTMMLSVAWGNRGGSIGLLALGIIVIRYTDQHKGPFFLKGLGVSESLLVALIYLSAAALLIVFIRALMRSNNCFTPDTERLSGSGVLYRFKPMSGIFYWENDLSSLLGSFSSKKLNCVNSILQHVHPSDREKLRQHWYSPIKNKHRSQTFRIKNANQEWVTLVDSSGIVMSNGIERIIVGNWQMSRYHLSF